MKKFLAIITSILIGITFLLFLLSISIRYSISSKNITNIVKSIPIEEKLNNNDVIIQLYDELAVYGITKEQVDNLLSSKKTSSYISEILQKEIQINEENQLSIISEIRNSTDQFLENIITEQQIVITEQEKEQLKEYLTTNATQHIQVNDSSANNQFVEILQLFSLSSTKNLCIICLLVELSILFLLTWSKKNVFAYIRIICLITTFIYFSFVLVLDVGFKTISKEFNSSFYPMLKPLFMSGYKLSFILFLVTIISFMIYQYIKKRIQEYEQIPF